MQKQVNLNCMTCSLQHGASTDQKRRELQSCGENDFLLTSDGSRRAHFALQRFHQRSQDAEARREHVAESRGDPLQLRQPEALADADREDLHSLGFERGRGPADSVLRDPVREQQQRLLPSSARPPAEKPRVGVAQRSANARPASGISAKRDRTTVKNWYPVIAV